jgi:hypothetical protein
VLRGRRGHPARRRVMHRIRLRRSR